LSFEVTELFNACLLWYYTRPEFLLGALKFGRKALLYLNCLFHKVRSEAYLPNNLEVNSVGRSIQRSNRCFISLCLLFMDLMKNTVFVLVFPLTEFCDFLFYLISVMFKVYLLEVQFG
jgi:hypothetical protein